MTISTRTVRPAPEEWPSDGQLHHEVQEQLARAQCSEPGRIGVSVDRGVVHLDGVVRDAGADEDVRTAVLRVRGVRAIVDRLSTSSYPDTDDDVLLERVLRALQQAAGVPAGIRPAVHGGTVTLSGMATWRAERDAAGRAVERLDGVRTLRNDIELTPRPSAADAEQRVQEALLRTAAVDPGSIEVRVEGTEVILEGAVHSYAQRQQAAAAAWSSPHVTQVRNRIHIAC